MKDISFIIPVYNTPIEKTGELHKIYFKIKE